MIQLLLQIFVSFFVIGIFNFGGGGAMIMLIQSEVVSARAWISEAAFTDIVAISQSTPGPIGINCATYVGYEVLYGAGFGQIAGILGSAVATLAIVLPSFIIFFLLVRIFDRYRSHPAFDTAMTALKPAVAALIAAAAIALSFNISADGITTVAANFPDWKSWVIAATALAASLFFKISPIWLILGGGIAGLLLF